MIYYPNIKTLFLASLGTGSHSLNRFLSKVNDENSTDPLEYNTEVTLPEVAYETLIASVANPYSRVYFKWNRRKEWLTREKRENEILSFPDFVKKEVYKTNPAISCVSTVLTANNITPTVIIRLESIKSDIKLIPGLNLVSNRNHRKSFERYIASENAINKNTLDWRNNYTQETADLIYTALVNDFTTYKYNKDSWK